MGEYIDLVSANDRESYVTGTITTSIGHKLDINDSVLVRNTLTITNQCLNDTSFNLGTVYAAELSFTFTTNIDRYELYNAVIELVWHIGGHDVPLGTYTATEAVRVGNKVSIKACDAMLDFDANVDEDTNGTIYDLLQHCCKMCGVPLGMSKEQVQALPNTADTQIYAILAERVETYRDAISYIATVTATFAVIADGALELRAYATESTRDISNSTRLKSAEFSDYKVRFCGVYGRFIANVNYYPYTHIEDGVQDALLLNLGDIPIVQGDEDFKHGVIEAIWDAVKDIEYTPCNIRIKPDPALKLGDKITNTELNNVAGTSCIGYVQYYEWAYRQPMTIKCMGDNAKLAAVKRKQNKELANLEAEIAGRDFTVQEYVNAKAYAADDSGAEIARMNFVAVEDCKPVACCMVQYELDRDGLVTFDFYLDNDKLDKSVSSYELAGPHFATLAITFDMELGDRKVLRIVASAEYMEHEWRERAADHTTIINFMDAVKSMAASGELAELTYDEGEIDTTPPVMNISEAGVRLFAYAQGLAAAAAVWDGTLTFTDVVEPIDIITPIVTVNKFDSSVTASQQTPDKSGLHDVFSMIEIDVPTITINAINANIVVTPVPEYWAAPNNENIPDYSDEFVISSDGYRLKTTWSYDSKPAYIDEGSMSICSVETRQFANVESVVINNE